MVPDPYGDAFVVENLTDVVRVHAVDDERHRRTTVLHRCGADDADTIDTRQAVNGRGNQLAFVGFDRVHAEGAEIARRRGQTDHLRGHRGTRLETLRRRRVRGGLHGDRLDHRTAGEEWRQGVEQLAAAVQHTDAVGAQHLMSRERGEVDIERVEVDRLMRHRLAGVQHGQRPDGPGPGDQFGHRRQRTRHVGMMAECNNFDAFVELQRVEVDAASSVTPYQRTSLRCGGRVPATGSDWHGARVRW